MKGLEGKTKDELERLKLIKDIESQSFNNRHLGSIIALVIGLLSAGSAYFLGVFDTKQDKLEAKSDRLQIEINNFEKQKQTIQFELRQKRDSLVVNIAELRNIKVELSRKTSLLAKNNIRLASTTHALSRLKNQFDSPIPLLTSDFSPVNSGFPGIALKNQGAGLIHVDEYKVYFRGEVYTVNSRALADRLINNITDELAIEGSHLSYHFFPKEQSVISSGERILLVGLIKEDYNINDQAKLISLEDKMLIVIKYHSASGIAGKPLLWGNTSLLK